MAVNLSNCWCGIFTELFFPIHYRLLLFGFCKLTVTKDSFIAFKSTPAENARPDILISRPYNVSAEIAVKACLVRSASMGLMH